MISDKTKLLDKKTALVVFLGFLAIMSYIFGVMIFSYLLSLAAGAMLALICYPILKRLLKLGVSVKLSSLLITLSMILLAVIPVSLVASMAIQQGLIFASALSGSEGLSTSSILERITDWNITDRLFSNAQAAKKQILEWLQEAGAFIITAIIAIASKIPDMLLQLALVVISFYYFLIDGPRFISWIYERVPLDPEVRKKIAVTFTNTTVSVILATIAAASVQTFIMGIAFFVLSVPLGFLATAATFIFAWVPLVGTTPVWLCGAIYLYANGFWIKAILMICFGVITSISDNLVRPLVLKGRSQMHPLVSLVAIFGGINLFGILGVFIGPIIAAVTVSLLQILPAIHERSTADHKK